MKRWSAILRRSPIASNSLRTLTLPRPSIFSSLVSGRLLPLLQREDVGRRADRQRRILRLEEEVDLLGPEPSMS